MNIMNSSGATKGKMYGETTYENERTIRSELCSAMKNLKNIGCFIASSMVIVLFLGFEFGLTSKRSG